MAAPAISPDGRQVAYRARRADGMPLLWVRDLASGDSQPLPGTEDATMPFWSPDSRDLGFFAGAALKRVSAAGGPVRLVTDNVGPWTGYGGTWAADGTIAFARAGRPVPRAGRGRCCRGESRRNCRAGIGRTTGRASCPTAAGSCSPRSCLPVPRKPANKAIYLGSLDSPTIDAAPAGPLECRLRAARLSRLRPRGHPHRGAVRPGRGPRHRPAGRDRRGRGDRRQFQFRGHFGLGRRDDCRATAADRGAGLPRFERVQRGTASGRSQRRAQPCRPPPGSSLSTCRSARPTAAR